MKILVFTFFLMLMMTEIFCAQTPPPIETGVSQSLAKWRSKHYSDVRYKLNITLEKGAPLMKGEIEIRVKVTEEGAKHDLILDWRETPSAGDKDKHYARVLMMNGAIFSTSTPLFENEHIIIPEGSVIAGENVFLIEFASPIKTSGAAVTRYVDKEDGAEYVYSLFVPSDASTAFPVFDQPDLKARFSLGVDVPKSWKVVSNTAIKSYFIVDGYEDDAPQSRATYGFAETKPISTYVFAFAAGEFRAVQKTYPNEYYGIGGGLPDEDKKILQEEPKGLIYVRKSQFEKFKPHIKEVFRLNRESIKYLEDWFDYKFPFPKYDLVLIPEFPFGGMEHAGATFLREDRIIFPTEPTKNDLVTRANVIFHEAAHQWFGDTVTMKWFDDLWLKEGFAEFMAYKTLEKVLPEYNAWKVFYERNKQAAYLTDVTRGTTPIYQEIPNLASAKSAYGNIVYRKAPSFLKQAEFYLGEKEFQTAVRAFLKKHEFANAEWTDLVSEFETASNQDLKDWANVWVKKGGLPIITVGKTNLHKTNLSGKNSDAAIILGLNQDDVQGEGGVWTMRTKALIKLESGQTDEREVILNRKSMDGKMGFATYWTIISSNPNFRPQIPEFVFPNYQDYGYGIFLLDEKSRAYVLANIQTEKDDFLRSMMWGSLWDSVRFYELAPEEYVDLVIKNFALSSSFSWQNPESSSTKKKSQNVKQKPTKVGTQNIIETDESTIQTLLGRVSTAMSYYLSEPSAVADGSNVKTRNAKINPPATAGGSDLSKRIETVLLERIANAETMGQRITFYRAFLNLASSENARKILKDILAGKSKVARFELRPKDKFDIVTRLIVLGDKDASALLANLEKTYTDDAAKRYAYAAKAGIPTAENKLKYWKDFTENKEISESWIESAFAVWNSSRHSGLTLPYLEKALAELPNLKKNRKIFFVNGWLASFIGGQKSAEALAIVNKFLADNPNLDKDLRLKILENADGLERAVKIRQKYGN